MEEASSLWTRGQLGAHAQRRRAESMGWCQQQHRQHAQRCTHDAALSALATAGLIDAICSLVLYFMQVWLFELVQACTSSVLHNASFAKALKVEAAQTAVKNAKRGAEEVQNIALCS